MTVNSLISVTALLLFAGFLAGSESAINSISRVFVEELQVKSSRAAAWVQKVVKEPARYLNVILFVRKAC
jgi:CBS domain containing-hemolysin-like protein